MTSRLSTKGQLIIPKQIRDGHGWRAGTELEIEDRGDCVVLRMAGRVPETTLEDLVGCTGYEGPPRSLEDMEAAIAAGAARGRRHDPRVLAAVALQDALARRSPGEGEDSSEDVRRWRDNRV